MPQRNTLTSPAGVKTGRAARLVFAEEVLASCVACIPSHHCFCRKVFDVSCFKDFNTTAPVSKC